MISIVHTDTDHIKIISILKVRIVLYSPFYDMTSPYSPDIYLHPNASRDLIKAARSPARVDSGVDYPCDQKQLDDYQMTPTRPRGIYGDANKVIMTFTEFLLAKPSSSEKRAMDNLRKTVWGEEWGPDSVIKGFHDIDNAFFGTALQNRVQIRWADAKTIKEKWGRENQTGTMITPGEGRSIICLCSDNIFDIETRTPWITMWRTVIHKGVVRIKPVWF